MIKIIDLEANYIDLIAEILAKTLPAKSKAFIFGSRSTGTAKPFSDIDLLIDAGRPLSIQELTTLMTGFDESLLPYKVDIADFNTINESFKVAIQDQLIQFPIRNPSFKMKRY